MKFNKIVKSLALTAGLVAGFSANAQMNPDYLDFSIDETEYNGTVKSGDKFNGGYVEELIFDGQGGFTTGAMAYLTALFQNNGTSPVFGTELADSYSLYAVLTASGTTSTNATDFTATQAQFSLYIDVNLDTGVDSLIDGTTTNNSDDILIGSASAVTNAYGQYANGTGNFNFDFTDFVLTTEGEEYFVDPIPFYSLLTVNGDFDTLANLPSVTGDLSAGFVAAPVNVPEPSTVAVLALGLVGLGMSARRKNK